MQQPKIRVNGKDVARKSIALAIVKDKGKVIALLKKHGVAVDSSYNNDKLIVATLVALRDKPQFQPDLKTLLVNSTVKSFTGEDGSFFSSFTGEGTSFFGSSFTGEDGKFFGAGGGAEEIDPVVASSSAATTGGPKKSTIGQIFSNPDTIGNILNTGLGVLSNSLKSKSDQKLANTALALETEKTKQAALLAEAAGKGGAAGGTAAGGMSTGLKVVLWGVGIIAFGTLTYFVIKWAKKKK